MEEEKKEKVQIINEKILLIILFIIVSLVGVFFASTYIRWNAEVSELNEVIYYGQDNIKISKLEDFYGNELDVDIDSNTALKLYCTSEYGNDCIIGNYVDNLENLFRNPRLIINMVIIIDLIIIYILIRKRNLKNIQIYIISFIILLYGVYSLGWQIFKMADYIGMVNGTEYVTNATIIKGVIPNTEDKFKPIIKYTTEEGEYVTFLDYIVKGKVEDKIGEELTIYYDSKDNLKIDIKRSILEDILLMIWGILIIIISIFYYKLKKADPYTLHEKS